MFGVTRAHILNTHIKLLCVVSSAGVRQGNIVKSHPIVANGQRPDIYDPNLNEIMNIVDF